MKRFAAALVIVLALAALPSPSARAQEEKPREAPKQAPQDPPKETPKEDSRLVAIGGLAASSLYYSFVIVGMTADSFAKDVYTADQVNQFVSEVSAMIKVNSDQLREVRKAGLAEGDAKQIDEILAAFELVQKYAQLLSDYAKDKSDKAIEAFQKQREETWEKIKNVLGLK